MPPTLRLGELILPTAVVGPPSPLPPLDPPVATVDVADGIPAEIAMRTRAGIPPSLLPYLMQDGYERSLTLQPLRVAMLENDRVRATIALDLGGRLWSLRDLATDRELLYVNPVVQPANLALRNAWFSGGVEWNIGTRGHSPTTMSTVHAARVDGVAGAPLLRLWEFERIRGTVFQVDLWLPDGAAVVAATIRVRNVSANDVPMYWWTNAAVVATAGTRVLSPATRAFRTEYPNTVRVTPIPVEGGVDVTRPANNVDAADYFFDVAGSRHPWVASVEADGAGVFHRSTPELRGHKLFVWGTGSGGERWQRWLSHDGGQRYAEIQAGLAPTQFEHVTMPSGADWAWTEVFGAVQLDPTLSHGEDWPAALDHAGTAIDGLADGAALDRWHASATTHLDDAPVETLANGTGWGALERRRRAASAAAWFDDRGTPFGDDTLGAEQQPWIDLLDRGELGESDPAEPPASYVIGDDWVRRLSTAPPTWVTEYHLAVIAHGAGDVQTAHHRYARSESLAPNVWATRGRAELARRARRPDDAATLALDAAQRAPDRRYLAAEAAERLLDADRPAEALALIDSLASPVRRHGRIRLLEGFAACAAGQPERAQRILDDELEVPDLREGERSIDDLWSLAYPDRPLPERYDFRMHRHREV